MELVSFWRNVLLTLVGFYDTPVCVYFFWHNPEEVEICLMVGRWTGEEMRLGRWLFMVGRTV